MARRPDPNRFDRGAVWRHAATGDRRRVAGVFDGNVAHADAHPPRGAKSFAGDRLTPIAEFEAAHQFAYYRPLAAAA